MKQGDCRGEPGGCCGWEGWAQARGQVAGLDTVEVGRPNLSLCLPKAFQEGGRAGLGDVVPPHGCLRGPCIPPGGLPCQPCLQPALPCRHTLNPQAAAAAWALGAAQEPTMQPGLVRPMPLGSRQKWIQTWMLCSCCSTSVYHRALSLQGIMLRVLINTNLINTNGRERPGQYGGSFPHCLSGEVQMLHRRGFRIMFLLT